MDFNMATGHPPFVRVMYAPICWAFSFSLGTKDIEMIAMAFEVCRFVGQERTELNMKDTYHQFQLFFGNPSTTLWS